MNDSVLDSVKSAMGIEPSDTAFDLDIIMHVNTVLAVLRQLGLSNSTTISGKEEKWSDIVSDGSDLEPIRTYVSLKVKKIFDPPSGSSSMMSSLNELINELEFRLNVAMEDNGEIIS